MISYLLQCVGITIICVACYIVNPVVGLAATGMLVTVVGVSLEKSKQD